MAEPSHVTSHTESEILSQPAVWRETLASLDLSKLKSDWFDGATDVIVTGCGSTYYLSLTVAELLRNQAHLHARALPASELLPDAPPQTRVGERAVLVAFSRSGTTTETVLAAEHFRRQGGHAVVVVTAEPDTPLAALADYSFAATAATERSVAQTRSFSSMLLVGQAMAAHLGGRDWARLERLSTLAEGLLATSRPTMAGLARDDDLSSFFFLASGPLFGIASEGMLKLKEMSLTVSEAFHTLEFRHGPMSMCDQTAAVIGLSSGERRSRELAVLDDVRALGASVLAVGTGAGVDVAELPESSGLALYLMPLQLLALERALAKQLDPDHPRHLTAVIQLDSISGST